MSAYRSIFFEPDWAHVRYHGWQDSWPDPSFRALSKRQGPVQRRLLMSELCDPSRVASILDRMRGHLMEEIVFHDFAAAPAIAEMLRSRGFAALGAADRMLNVATFAIDLERTDEALLQQMSADVRRKIRKAEAARYEVEAEERPSPATITEFIEEFGTMAKERGLHAPRREMVERMFADGRSLLVSVREDGQPPHLLMTYRAGDKAIYLYGVGRAKTNSGAGHLLQWVVMRELRARGVRWYDMGGLPAIGDEDGIFRFKRGFGGQLVELGVEYGKRSLLMGIARREKAIAALRRLGRR
jgi:hypothetical protein